MPKAPLPSETSSGGLAPTKSVKVGESLDFAFVLQPWALSLELSSGIHKCSHSSGFGLGVLDFKELARSALLLPGSSPCFVARILHDRIRETVRL